MTQLEPVGDGFSALPTGRRIEADQRIGTTEQLDCLLVLVDFDSVCLLLEFRGVLAPGSTTTIVAPVRSKCCRGSMCRVVAQLMWNFLGQGPSTFV